MIPTLSGLSVWFFAKIAALVLLAMYLIFALVVVRQVRLFTDTLKLGYEGLIIMLAYLHLAFAVLVLLAAIIIL